LAGDHDLPALCVLVRVAARAAARAGAGSRRNLAAGKDDPGGCIGADRHETPPSMDAVSVRATLLGLDLSGQTESARNRRCSEEETMSFEIGHVHLKTTDPKKTADYYVENFGGKLL